MSTTPSIYVGSLIPQAGPKDKRETKMSNTIVYLAYDQIDNMKNPTDIWKPKNK